MYKDNVNGISIASVLDDHNKSKEGVYPVKIKITVNRASSYYQTGKKLSKENWDKLPDSRIPELAKVRQSIKASFDLIVKRVEELSGAGNFSIQSLNIRLGRESGGTVDSYYKSKIDSLLKEKRAGTAINDSNALIAFQKYAGKNIKLEAVTVEWLKNMERMMLDDNISVATVGIRMRSLRAVMSIAKDDGVISEAQYPFGKKKYQIKKVEGIKKALTLEQIHKVVTYKTDNEADRFFLDIWFFIYLCNGINVSDLVDLKYKDIINGEIKYIRNKTERTSKTLRHISIPVTPPMTGIIKKWGNEPEPENHIFRLMEHSDDPVVQKERIKNLVQMINRRSNKVGRELGYGGITTYTARHSFATVLKRSGTNIAFISESLGHSDLKTTEHYLASFEPEERKKNAMLLTMFPEEEKTKK